MTASATEQERDDQLAAAESAFLTASVAVWLEIDRLESQEGSTYQGIAASTKLRRDERAAWICYRDALTAAGRLP